MQLVAVGQFDFVGVYVVGFVVYGFDCLCCGFFDYGIGQFWFEMVVIQIKEIVEFVVLQDEVLVGILEYEIF